MSQSLSQTLIHIVFSTKYRMPLIHDEIRSRFHAYLAETLRANESFVYNVGGTRDHVHILCLLPRTHSQSELIGELKRVSSKWIKRHGVSDFYWQRGYGCFSVSNSHRNRVISYIDHQMEHHKIMTFKEEFIGFLRQNRIEYDDKYIWE